MWSELRGLKEEVDYGTPPKDGAPVKLFIDDVEVTVPAGSSVMLAATVAGNPVPKLCATDMLDAFGSCRVCLVEVEGRGGFPASCTTPVVEGMRVRTRSENLDRLRRGPPAPRPSDGDTVSSCVADRPTKFSQQGERQPQHSGESRRRKT